MSKVPTLKRQKDTRDKVTKDGIPRNPKERTRKKSENSIKKYKELCTNIDVYRKIRDEIDTVRLNLYMTEY